MMHINNRTIAVMSGICLGVLLLQISSSLADLASREHMLHPGKNNLELNSSILASELVANNPQIQSISYRDPQTNITIGYVNVFGGIGSNFYLQPQIVYEISVNESINLYFPH